MRMTEKQLANLKPVRTKKEARERGRNGGLKKKENEPIRKAHEAAKKEIIRQAYGQILEKLENKELSTAELISVFKSAIDISGDKTEKQEVELSDNLEIKVFTEEKEDD